VREKRGQGWEGLKDMVLSRWRPRPRLGEEEDVGRQLDYENEKKDERNEGGKEEEEELDLVNHYGRSPLWKACCQGHVEVARALLAAGCDPFLNDDQGVSPRAVAEEKGYAAVVALIDVSGGKEGREGGMEEGMDEERDSIGVRCG